MKEMEGGDRQKDRGAAETWRESKTLPLTSTLIDTDTHSVRGRGCGLGLAAS